MRSNALAFRILGSVSATIFLACPTTTPVLPPELTGVCRAPSFEEFCSARRAHLLTKDDDPFGLDAGQGWLTGFPDRCGTFDRVPTEWKAECAALEAAGGIDGSTPPD